MMTIVKFMIMMMMVVIIIQYVVYAYVYKYVCVRTYVRALFVSGVHACLKLCAHVFNSFMRACLHVRVRILVRVRAYVCECVRVCTRTRSGHNTSMPAQTHPSAIVFPRATSSETSTTTRQPGRAIFLFLAGFTAL